MSAVRPWTVVGAIPPEMLDKDGNFAAHGVPINLRPDPSALLAAYTSDELDEMDDEILTFLSHREHQRVERIDQETESQYVMVLAEPREGTYYLQLFSRPSQKTTFYVESTGPFLLRWMRAYVGKTEELVAFWTLFQTGGDMQAIANEQWETAAVIGYL